MKYERKYISGFGAVILSKKEAMDVADSANRPNNIFVYVTGYKEDNQTRLGYLFYRDYGNEAYASYVNKITSIALQNHNLTEMEGYNITRLCPANKGDILEAVMGYEWIYNKMKWDFLRDFP
eukprot:12094888-Heterocapsa_arctica.AAC.1